jgi:CHAT domain-containing protein
LWWCATGDLGFLPIHAAGKYRGAGQEGVADYVVSSYTPTLSTLIRVRRGWQPVPRSHISGVLISEASAAGVAYLPNVGEEARVVCGCFEEVHAQLVNTHSTHTTVDQARTLLEGTPAHVLHMACHGVQQTNPLDSAFVLGDGRLSIEDIMQLDLPHAVLAFLSACQTAKGDRSAPDEAVHLAASMLFCGFRSVIGTMWCVEPSALLFNLLMPGCPRLMHDTDGPKIARRVYEGLFARDQLDLDDIPYALDEAVRELRCSGVISARWALFVHLGG